MTPNKKPAGEMKEEANVSATENTQPKSAAAAVKRGPAVAKRSARKEAEELLDPEVKIESAIGKTEEWIIRNGKILLTALTVIVLVVAGILAYKYLYIGGRAEKAAAAMFVAEQQFLTDSYDVALNGDGNNAGFLQIIEKFGSTPQGNVARHYAGLCYVELGDLDNGLKYLGEYKPVSGAPADIINAQNAGLQGDIYVQKGEYDKAAAQFDKAVEASSNPLTAPYYLKKLGMVYDHLGKATEATAAYQRIADEFSTSMEGRDIEKYIGAREQK